MPALGLGTWKLNGAECTNTVINAIEMGYTHIDTASAYNNEADIGVALRETSLKRTSLFITTKIWYDRLSRFDVENECGKSLQKLRTDYIDLLLIHWPNKNISLRDTFQGFVRLFEKKLVRSFGVSNFTIAHINEALKASSGIPVCVNQVEFHPFLNQSELLSYCNSKQIRLTAYAPVARGSALKNPVLLQIAGQCGATPVQCCLAWLRQKGVAAIPKSSSDPHLKENLQSLNLTLSQEQMAQIDALDRGERLVNPEWAEF
jgi:2,5-diketo-D-gluconate reductase B